MNLVSYIDLLFRFSSNRRSIFQKNRIILLFAIVNLTSLVKWCPVNLQQELVPPGKEAAG